MSTYGFKISRKGFEISLTSHNPDIIKVEYEKFAASFLGVNLEDILPEKDEKYSADIISNTTIQQISTALDLTQDEQPFSNIAESPVKTLKKKKDLKNKLPANFASMLAEKTKEATNNVVEKKTSELKNTYVQMQSIIKEKALKNEIDYIVVAAYCLTHYENMLHFPEEQIKAKMAPFFRKKLDHNIVLDAVAKNLIKVVPDFTGMSDEIEYELTEQGEEYFLNEL